MSAGIYQVTLCAQVTATGQSVYKSGIQSLGFHVAGLGKSHRRIHCTETEFTGIDIDCGEGGIHVDGRW